MESVVDHYFGLLSADVLPSDAFCLTAVQGLTVDEALERFDGYAGWAAADLAELGQRATAVYPDELPTVIADEVDGWVLLAENNGWHGAKTSVLQRLSADTVVASAFWNVNRHSMISLARDGQVLAAFDFVIDRERPAALVPHLAGQHRARDFGQPAVHRLRGLRAVAKVRDVARPGRCRRRPRREVPAFDPRSDCSIEVAGASGVGDGRGIYAGAALEALTCGRWDARTSEAGAHACQGARGRTYCAGWLGAESVRGGCRLRRSERLTPTTGATLAPWRRAHRRCRSIPAR